MKNKVNYEKEYEFLRNFIDNNVDEDFDRTQSKFLGFGIKYDNYNMTRDFHRFEMNLNLFKVIVSVSNNTVYMLFERDDEVKELYEVFMDDFNETCEYHNYTDLSESYMVEIDNKATNHSNMEKRMIAMANKLVLELNAHLLSVSKCAVDGETKTKKRKK